MADTPHSPNPAAGPDVAAMQQLVERVEKQLLEIQEVNKANRRRVSFAILFLVAMVAVFLWATVSSVRDNFTQAKVVAAIQPRIDELRPSVEMHAVRLVREVVPVYRDEALSRFQAIRPQLIRAGEEEIERLPKAVMANLTKQLEDSLNRLTKRLEPDIKTVFPALTDPKAIDRLTAHFEERVLVEGDKMADHLVKIHFNQELNKVYLALRQFKVPNADAVDQSILERQFLHSLLMLVDYHVTNTDDTVQTQLLTIDGFSK